MRLASISISNFRRLTNLTIELAPEATFLIAENAGGKTSVLVAIARALGRDLAFERADFADTTLATELVATFEDFTLADQSDFAEQIEFLAPHRLRVGVRAVWDPLSEQAEITHGFPSHSWVRSTREQRDAIQLLWLPAWRDPSRMLAFGASRGLLVSLLERLPLSASLQQALQEVQQAAQTLSNDLALRGALDDAGTFLGELIPAGTGVPFDVGIAAATERDLLKQFELLMSHDSPSIPVVQQSSGLRQLAVFVFAVRLLQEYPESFLLVDEPEISLHPQAQRALVALLTAAGAQALIATHSSNILDGVDPRHVVRVHQSGGTTTAARAAQLTDDEARRLARLSTALSAEAFFARKVILVEGISDVLAVRAMARRSSRNLDAEGVSILSIDGGGGLAAYVKLLGPAGLGLGLLGLCDADQEPQWQTWLEDAGLGSGLDRAAMEGLGFFVCDRDLEDELIRATGVVEVENIIASQGEQAAYEAFIRQPAQSGASQEDQQRAFFRKAGRKARYAPLLVDATTAGSEPRPLREVLARA